jgi:hypothetical protein
MTNTLEQQTKCTARFKAQRTVVIPKEVIRETGIHYSNKPVALLAEKKGFEGSRSTTRMIRRRC